MIQSGSARLVFGPDGGLRNGWKALLFFIANNLAGALVVQLAPLVPIQAALLPDQGLLLLGCLAVSWLFLRVEGASLGHLGLRLGWRWTGEFLAGALGGAAIMGLTVALLWAAGGVHLARTPGAGLAQLLQGAWLYLAVALYEELVFRGYLFQRLERGLGPWATQGLLAVLFALAHWDNPGMAGATRVWACLNIALASILLGLCYLRTRSLALPMGLHLGWNWTQGSLLGFGVSGTAARGWWTPVFQQRPEWLSGGAFGLEAGLPCALICAAACWALYGWLPAKPPECRESSSH